MSYESVDIFVKDTTLLRNPIAGVVVKVFSSNGVIVFGQSTTDAGGKASFLLPSGQTYSTRLYKQNVGFANPLMFEVLDPADLLPGQTNSFDMSGAILTPPTVTDPRLCVAYGFFRDPSGAPAEGIDLHFINKFKPLWMDGAAVMSEKVIQRTDNKGYAEVSLFRNAQYDVQIQGLHPYSRLIYVPDAPNVNLPDLLFPVVSSVSFDVGGPYELSMSGTNELVLVPTVLASDGRVLDKTAVDDVCYKSSDDSVMAVLWSSDNIVLRAIGPGTAQLKVERLDNSIVRIPDVGIAGQPVTVTVTS